MEKVRFRVVHFNNGMHGWAYREAQYKAGFAPFLSAVRSLVDKDGALIWASTTPVRQDETGAATNSRVDERNAIAFKVVKAVGIEVDDQHALMAQHRDLYLDSLHFNTEGAQIAVEADIMADSLPRICAQLQGCDRELPLQLPLSHRQDTFAANPIAAAR